MTSKATTQSNLPLLEHLLLSQRESNRVHYSCNILECQKEIKVSLALSCPQVDTQLDRLESRRLLDVAISKGSRQALTQLGQGLPCLDEGMLSMLHNVCSNLIQTALFNNIDHD